MFKPTRLAAVLAWILSEVASAGAVPNDAEQVRALQNDLIKAYINHDIGEIDRILADDYTFVSDQGEVETKGQVIANFKAGGDRTITVYEVHDPHIRVYGDAAVMVYRYTSTETYKGRDDSGNYVITRVFVRSAGGWRIVSGHETRVAHESH